MACRFRLAALLSALMTVCLAMQDMEDQAMGLDLTLTYGCGAALHASRKPRLISYGM